MRSPITLALLLSAPLCQAFMAASPTTLGAAGARTSHAAVMIAERRKVAPKKSVGRGSAATKSPSKKGSLPARTKAISFDFLSGFGGEHKAATTTKAEKVEGLKLPEVPSFKMPSFGGSAQESAPPPKPKFPVSMPSMSMPSVAIPSDMPLPSFSLPSLASPAAAPTSTPTEADDAPVESESAVEPRASDDLASTVTKGLKTLGNLMLNTLTTLLQLLLAKAQLAALRQFRATQAAVDARIAQVEAAPTLLLAKLRRAAYVAPFYARAALELFAEDAQRSKSRPPVLRAPLSPTTPPLREHTTIRRPRLLITTAMPPPSVIPQTPLFLPSRSPRPARRHPFSPAQSSPWPGPRRPAAWTTRRGTTASSSRRRRRRRLPNPSRL